jgi:hypothetical protein
MTGPWREPAEETVGLYPELVVDDGRVTGSITFGRTRLPIWAPQWCLDDLEDYTTPDDTREAWQSAAESFIRDLLEARGEFARLLLVLADAERREHDRTGAVLDAHTGPDGGLVNVSPWDPDAVQLPPAWWDDPALYTPVADALRRCLTCLEDQP